MKNKLKESGGSANCYVCNREIDYWQAYEWHGKYTKDGVFYHEVVCPKCMADACLAQGLSVEAMDIHKEHCTGCSFCERGD